MAMADLSEHYKIKTVGTPFGVSCATLSSAEGFSTTMSIVRPDPIDFRVSASPLEKTDAQIQFLSGGYVPN
jgi:hypothetical protein